MNEVLIERSVLRLRENPHIDTRRNGEVIVEVVRNGEVVATIYGTREGIQIASHLFRDRPSNGPMPFEGVGMPSFILPLLQPEEACPWCGGRQKILLGGKLETCPICLVPA